MSGLLGVLTGGVSTLLGPVVNRLLDLIPDPVQKAQMQQELTEKMMAADQQMESAQAAIDQVEAGSTNMFVAGWRPAVGWVCVFALAWQVAIEPMLAWGVALAGYKITFPVLDGSYISLLLIPMMGLGVARTVEKMNSVPDSTPLQNKKR